MATVETQYKHIVLDEQAVPHIAGTTMKVVELVTAQQANGWSPAELQVQFPYLSLGQIHSALAYYWDHQAMLDQDIDRRLKLVETLRRQAPPSAFRQRRRLPT
jgi:uncharacterized protein (DUF433 family)